MPSKSMIYRCIEALNNGVATPWQQKVVERVARIRDKGIGERARKALLARK